MSKRGCVITLSHDNVDKPDNAAVESQFAELMADLRRNSKRRVYIEVRIKNRTVLLLRNHVQLSSLSIQQRSFLFTKLNNYKRSRRVGYEEFYPDKSKPVIDKIDSTLAKYYKLTIDELDFIINYDIKYRMGAEVGEEGVE